MFKPNNPEALCTPGIPATRAQLILCASTFVNARAALCFGKLLDTSVWRDWNHLVPEVAIRSQPPEDEWDAPFLSRNPSTARGAQSPPRSPADSRLGSISDVGFSRDASLDVPPHARPCTSSPNLYPPLGSKVGTGNHLPIHDPFEGRRGLSPTSEPVRRFSLSSNGGEPSVRLRLGTLMTFKVVLDQSKPEKQRKTELVVSELLRPGDQPAGQNPVYRIMWESDTDLTFPYSLPKWLLFCQRVTEIRPVIRGDGKEECEISTWECQRGLLAPLVKKYYGKYLQRMFQQNVEGLRDYCEAMGGAVDRRDFSVSS
jgi:hypothetical protein